MGTIRRLAIGVVMLGANAGCVEEEPAVVNPWQLKAGYDFEYQHYEGQTLSDSRDWMAIQKYDEPPGDAHFGLWRRDVDEFELAIGMRDDTPIRDVTGACPPMASARFWLRGIADSEQPRTFDVATLGGSAVNIYYADGFGDARCPHYVEQGPDTVTLGASELTLAGTLTLDELTCTGARSELGCPLRASGSWQLVARDSEGTTVLSTSGSFRSDP